MSVEFSDQIRNFRSSPLRFQLLFLAAAAMIPIGFALAVLGGPQASLLIYAGIYLSIVLLLAVLAVSWMIIQISGESS